MSAAAAKQGDKIKANDTHTVIDGSSGSPKPGVFTFEGQITEGLSKNVKIAGQFAATVGSTADNTPEHNAGSDSFKPPSPSNKGEITAGSSRVHVNGKSAARHGDAAKTCNEPPEPPVGKVFVDDEENASVKMG